MSKELSTTVISEEGIVLSIPEKQRLLDQALTLLHHADMKEWQAYLLRSAFFWELRTKKLHDAGSISFESYCLQLGYQARMGRRYAQVGQLMFEMSVEHAKQQGVEIDPLNFTFTQKRITEVFEGYFTNGHAITITGLSKAASSLEQFKAYLAGEIDGDDRARKLLAENNVVSEKRLEAANATQDFNSMKSFHAHMRDIAKEKGLKWNREKFCFENLDGSPLRDDQKVEFADRERGLEVWHESFKAIRSTKQQIARAARTSGEFYKLYDSVPDTNFRNMVTDMARSFRNEIESMEEMLECLLAKDFPRLEELAKKRADIEIAEGEVAQ